MPKKSGFTLIELLIVVVIIAVLSAIGYAVYSGLTKNARDPRRRADIDAIAKAYEVKFDKSGQTAYSNPADADFSTGKIPVPPEGGNYYSVTDSSGFKACAKLEGFPGTDAYCNTTSQYCFCKSSAQGRIQTGTTINGTGSEIGTGDVNNNKITNSSFEGGSSSPWDFYLYCNVGGSPYSVHPPNPATGGSIPQCSLNGSGLVVTNEQSYLGSSSYKIIGNSGNGEIAIQYPGLTLISDKCYRYSAWIYSTTSVGAIQGNIGGWFTQYVPQSRLNQWYQVSVTRRANATSPAFRCGLFGTISNPQATVYCDSIALEEVPASACP